MCVASAISDDFGRRWPSQPGQPWDGLWPHIGQPPAPEKVYIHGIYPSKQEFEQLQKEVAELRVLLEKSKLYDNEHNEPECEVEEKIAAVKRFSKMFGISFEGIFDGEFVETQSRDYEPYHVIGPEGEAGRFADEGLAEKFAAYLSKYNPDNNYAVVTVFDVSNLKFGVSRDGILIGSFDTAEKANNFIVNEKRIHLSDFKYKIVNL